MILESVTDNNVPQSTDVVVPNEPQSLDDCHFRYYEFGKTTDIKPTGSTTAYLGEFAHMAAIGWIKSGNNITWDCGGSLISENFVLTAAHCSEIKDPDVVRIGDIDLSENPNYQPEKDIKILEFIGHPNHTFRLRYHDIALVRLERKVELSATVAPACLWHDDEIRFKALEAAGWGATGFGENKTSTLSKVTLRPFENSECNKLIGEDDRKLPYGLDSNQMCAGDERQDTCEGDSGGPLQVKLLHNTRLTPFVVAVTSFGKPCGMRKPGVYIRVAPYIPWIKSVLNARGVADADWLLDPQACARKYVNLREYEPRVLLSKNKTNEEIDPTKAHLFDESSEQLVRIHWNNLKVHRSNECYGVIIDESTVLTLARCTMVNGTKPTHVTFAGNKPNIITNSHKHPAYVEGSFRNDIGVLKVKEPFEFNADFTPACVWTKHSFLEPEIEVTARGLLELNAFYANSPPEFNRISLQHKVNVLGAVKEQNGTNCSLPKHFVDRIPSGLTQEHVCFGAEPFLVPGTCNQAFGGSLQRKVFRYGRSLMYVNALNLFGRDCGFGESAVAVRLAHHRRWLESVLYPPKKPEAPDDSDQVIFLNEALEEGDNCTAPNKLPGVCVNERFCPKVTFDFKSSREVMFCKTGSLVCCPHRYIRDETNDDAGEIDACKRIEEANMDEEEGSGDYGIASASHVVSIVWVYGKFKHTCIGTIISKRSVLTAASCVDPSKHPSHVELIDPTEQIRAFILVEEMIIHPEYDSITSEHNLALIKTKHTTVIDGFAKSPACLWKNTTHTPFMMEQLLFVNKTTIEQKAKSAYLKFNTDCRQTMGRVLTDSELCLKVDKLLKPTASIQAGMPAFWARLDGGYLVGIASRRSSVSDRSIVLYTRIASYVDWIKSEV
ncbi:uncharacterized protein LOC126571957 isoform X8 [Anopheles aquasalis]|uniref:uncharacterized protein LOC126571957 isoform X5 n=1 Tax=Anopheles aquasalis TaxID=42839 RepID=UPI00215AA590|nr:uncharacterized protein LOC126571957 isoform X5 [Anopheles aquasalis]XP_050086836.1 uncharacterized protein LOC126571957 isoform X6 [Anopheles aquasalis]XP_050086837.1 uncharacterized protein LOC126571957 isoform X7 [Anopheles aquasalis]XP_050086838.1 uncharacterized protein LOC126571957 isoform X8 [Anopheles aquasalis]